MDGKQLKNSILQWAIQGKLVEQLPKEGSASDLYEKILAEKQALIKAGKLKKEKPLPPISLEDIPFEIPKEWKWCRIGDIFTLQAGKNIASSEIYNSKSKEHQYPCYGGNGRRGYVSTYNRTGHFCIIGRQGALCGNVNFANGTFYATEHAVVVDVYSNVDVSWSGIFLSALNLNQYATATAQPGLAVANINKVLIPLPPIGEQKRIVAKLEKLLPLIDEFSAAQEQLDKLNKELPEALKKSILQEAIQGKLVPQNPKDEPAQKLLDRITAARGEGSQPKGAKSKKSTPTSRIYCENGIWYEQIGNTDPKDISEDIPFEIPENWIWCRLNSICDYLHRGKSPFYSDMKILPVMAQKCNQWDRIYTEKCLFADPKTIDRYLPEHFLQLGDVLINSTGGGTVGRTGYVDEYVFSDYDKFVADSHVTVVRSNKNICSKYVYYFLITPLIQIGIEERCSGSTNQIELGTETIKNYLIPLPPLAEQKRIITKLEQLFKAL